MSQVGAYEGCKQGLGAGSHVEGSVTALGVLHWGRSRLPVSVSLGKSSNLASDRVARNCRDTFMSEDAQPRELTRDTLHRTFTDELRGGGNHMFHCCGKCVFKTVSRLEDLAGDWVVDTLRTEAHSRATWV